MFLCQPCLWVLLPDPFSSRQSLASIEAPLRSRTLPNDPSDTSSQELEVKRSEISGHSLLQELCLKITKCVACQVDSLFSPPTSPQVGSPHLALGTQPHISKRSRSLDCSRNISQPKSATRIFLGSSSLQLNWQESRSLHAETRTSETPGIT